MVPEGVEAYYVKNVSDVNGETMAVAKRVEEGEVIPAGQGVLLTLAASIDIGVKDDGDGVDAGSSFSNTHDRFGGTAAPWENPDE